MPTLLEEPQDTLITEGVNANFFSEIENAATADLQWYISLDKGDNYVALSDSLPFTGVKSGQMLLQNIPVSLDSAF